MRLPFAAACAAQGALYWADEIAAGETERFTASSSLESYRSG